MFAGGSDSTLREDEAIALTHCSGRHVLSAAVGVELQGVGYLLELGGNGNVAVGHSELVVRDGDGAARRVGDGEGLQLVMLGGGDGQGYLVARKSRSFVRRNCAVGDAVCNGNGHIGNKGNIDGLTKHILVSRNCALGNVALGRFGRCFDKIVTADFIPCEVSRVCKAVNIGDVCAVIESICFY